MKICISGYEGSGKDTVATMMVNEFKFVHHSFADNLKKALCIIFGWDFILLQGSTPESRIWREQVDVYWEKELNKPGLTPRKVLQWVGTDVMRDHFDDGIWIKSLKKKLITSSDHIVISDCRFPNEIDMIRSIGGIVIRVVRDEPSWKPLYDQVKDIDTLYKEHGIHPCETALVAYDNYDYVIKNDGTLEELHEKIDIMMTDILMKNYHKYKNN